MKNDYAKKMQQERQALLDIGVDVGIQMMADFMSLALNEPEIMRKNALGAVRLKKALARAQELHGTFAEAFRTGPEADYFRAKLDERLKQIFGNEAVAFEERYPMAREIKYK